MTTITQPAYAKLNLTLDILGRRPDGYHELRMVMHAISLHDTVALTLDTAAPWSITCEDEQGCVLEGVPQDRRNLAWRAAECFFQHTGCEANGLAMRIVKRIPSQAGLGGGSADAAAVLTALNRYYGDPLSKAQLCQLGAQVGSDVPFCVMGGTAIACGRGERLEAVEGIAPLFFVICKPEFGISTPALFSSYDRWHDEQRSDETALLTALRRADLTSAGSLLCNVLEPVALREHASLSQIRQALLDAGACGTRMTGSGSAVFGLFSGEEATKRAAATLCAMELGRVFCAKSA